MTNPRDILNKIKWKQDYDIKSAEIWYIHRGAPNNTKIISGNEILKLEKSFMQTKTSSIPYHRIFKIIYKGDLIFERKKV
jgi:uncharacterized protein (UPF0248 family)